MVESGLRALYQMWKVIREYDYDNEISCCLDLL